MKSYINASGPTLIVTHSLLPVNITTDLNKHSWRQCWKKFNLQNGFPLQEDWSLTYKQNKKLFKN